MEHKAAVCIHFSNGLVMPLLLPPSCDSSKGAEERGSGHIFSDTDLWQILAACYCVIPKRLDPDNANTTFLWCSFTSFLSPSLMPSPHIYMHTLTHTLFNLPTLSLKCYHMTDLHARYNPLFSTEGSLMHSLFKFFFFPLDGKSPAFLEKIIKQLLAVAHLAWQIFFQISTSWVKLQQD